MKCDFQNQYMTSPCGRSMMKNLYEWLCIIHGTRYTEIQAPDLVADNPGATWTELELRKLAELFKRGYSIEDIAKILGRTYNSVTHKVRLIRNGGVN